MNYRLNVNATDAHFNALELKHSLASLAPFLASQEQKN